MDQLRQLLARFTLRQRVIIGAAAILVFAGVMYWSRWHKEQDFKPLFTNLAAEDAGQVVTRIRESGVDYRLAENGSSILVPSSKAAELRLQLASAGLPKTGRMGFELFDKTNFGATDFTEQINYHRALEGELERSMMSLAEVEQARVHLTFPKESIYLEERKPAKASVLLKLKLGSTLSSQNVLAICHLTASAVEGLTPENISVLDMNGNLLSRPKKPGLPDGVEPDDAGLEYRQKIERDLLAKVNATLEPLLGAEKYHAGLTVECDFSSGEQSEETFDPTKSVMVTSQRSDDSSTGLMSAGVPGTASNLPRPTSQSTRGTNGSNRRTENISYQTSRLVKRLKLPQGNIKRISVSVILDQAVRQDKGQKVIEPPSPEKLKVVKDLVAGVVGIQAERGDQVIVESLPFDATLMRVQPPPAPQQAPPSSAQKAPSSIALPAWLQQAMQNKNFRILAGVGGAVLLLLLGASVWLMLRMRKKKKAKAALVAEEAAKALAAPDPEKEFQARMAEQEALKEQQAKEVLSSLKVPVIKTKKAEVLLKQIVAEAKKDPAGMAQVIRTWLNSTDNKS